MAEDPRDLIAIAYRVGVIDRHFNRPPRSTDPWYLKGYEDPDPNMPPQYRLDAKPWPLGLRLEHKRRGQR
jgi:hypothetical protein